MSEPKTALDFKDQAIKIAAYYYDSPDLSGNRIKLIAAYLFESYQQGMHDQITNKAS